MINGERLLSYMEGVLKGDYTKFIRKSGYLKEYNFINQLIIHNSNNKALIVRTETEWLKCGCTLKQNENGINILIPLDRTEYVEAGTLNNIGNKLNVDEIRHAERLGIIERISKISGFEQIDVYDISQVSIKDAGKFKCSINDISRIKIKMSDILKVAERLTGYKVLKGDKTYCNNDSIYIGNEDAHYKISKILKICINTLVNNIGIGKYVDKELTNEEDIFIEQSVYAAITGYCRIDKGFIVDNAADICNIHLSKDSYIIYEIMDIIMNIIYIIVSEIDNCIFSNTTYSSLNGLKIKKAERLLSILEANSARLNIE